MAVVIPVYRRTMTPVEHIAWTQCQRTLGAHPTVLVAPRSLDLGAYLAAGDISDVVRFDDRWFQSTSSYSRLLMGPTFYRAFIKYEYILIHQLDAIVFSDQLADWCERDYDYVGAPWLDGWNTVPYHFRGARRIASLLPGGNDPVTVHVGNGGFSLRRVRSCLREVSRGLLVRMWPYNEDGFFAVVGARSDRFTVPSLEEALLFAFEGRPRECYARTGGVLPFGAHAWYAWDADFYRPFLKAMGYDVS